jgi:hypothetical protein
LSTLTKVLIVLLSVFSLFLCGVVVTYVANAENYRQTAERQRSDVQVAKNRQRDAEEELTQAKQATEETKKALEEQISEMTINISNLQAQLDSVKRENAQLVQDVANMGATVKLANETQAKQLGQSQADQTRVTALLADQTRLGKELAETNQTLLDKMSIIATLQDKNRQLVEANQDLETRLNQYLQQYGKMAPAPKPVTPTRGIAQPAAPAPQDIALNGRITDLDIKNSLAAISIGTAAGVKQNMKFHVTRGDQFVCNVEILYVDTERSVGTLKLVQTEPRIGDMVTTNL